MFLVIFAALISIGLFFIGGYALAKKDGIASATCVLMGSLFFSMTVFISVPQELSWGLPSASEISLGEHRVEFAVVVGGGKVVYVGISRKSAFEERRVLFYRFSPEVFDDMELSGKRLRVFDKEVSVSGYPSETKVTVRRLSLQ